MPPTPTVALSPSGFVGTGYSFTECHRENLDDWPASRAATTWCVTLGSEWSVYWPHVAESVAAEAELIRTRTRQRRPDLRHLLRQPDHGARARRHRSSAPRAGDRLERRRQRHARGDRRGSVDAVAPRRRHGSAGARGARAQRGRAAGMADGSQLLHAVPSRGHRDHDPPLGDQRGRAAPSC